MVSLKNYPLKIIKANKKALLALIFVVNGNIASVFAGTSHLVSSKNTAKSTEERADTKNDTNENLGVTVEFMQNALARELKATTDSILVKWDIFWRPGGQNDRNLGIFLDALDKGSKKYVDLLNTVIKDMEKDSPEFLEEADKLPSLTTYFKEAIEKEEEEKEKEEKKEKKEYKMTDYSRKRLETAEKISLLKYDEYLRRLIDNKETKKNSKLSLLKNSIIASKLNLHKEEIPNREEDGYIISTEKEYVAKDNGNIYVIEVTSKEITKAKALSNKAAIKSLEVEQTKARKEKQIRLDSIRLRIDPFNTTKKRPLMSGKKKEAIDKSRINKMEMKARYNKNIDIAKEKKDEITEQIRQLKALFKSGAPSEKVVRDWLNLTEDSDIKKLCEKELEKGRVPIGITYKQVIKPDGTTKEEAELEFSQ